MKKFFIKNEVRISLVYWFFGIVWIYLTDFLLENTVHDPTLLTRIQNIKGWIFVTASALLIFLLFRFFARDSIRAEEILRESEEKFRSVFESSNVGKSITSLDGKISVNKAYAEMLGYTQEELIHKTWQMLTPEEEIEPIQAILQPLLIGEKDSARFKKRYIHKNGAYVWADVSVVIRRDENGKPLHFITTIIDISVQKRSEEALIHSHDLMRYIIEHNRSAIAVHDKDLKYIYVSQRYLQDYKVKDKDIIGKHHYAVFPDLPQKWRDVHQKALAGETSSAEDDPYVRDDGSVEWTRWECRPWYQSDRSIGGIIVYTEVITQRKQMEQALRESEERLRLAVDSAQQGIYDLNIKTGDVIVNDIYAKMLGYEPENFHETVDTWKHRLHPDDSSKTIKIFNDYINGVMDEYRIEFRLKSAENNWIWILSIGSIVDRDENGKPLRMMGTHTDITHTKNTEHEKMLFSRIFEDSLNEIYIFEANTLKFKQVNQAALNNLGFSMDDLKNMTPLDLKPLINWDEFANLTNPLITGEKEQIVFETLHQRKDQTTYPIEARLQLLQFDNEILFTAIILDITKRKQTEETLLSERQRFADIISATNVGTWEWNIQTGECVFNDRWAEIIGYTLKEISPVSIDTWKKFAHPEDFESSQTALEQHFKQELEFYEQEVRMMHKDGHWVWVLDRGKVSSWSKDGKALIMQGTHQDITGRKTNEAKIMEQLQELKRWHNVTLGREERILELKRDINHLLKESGREPRFSISSEDLHE
jgi:PAS domain S-box-containing protein